VEIDLHRNSWLDTLMMLGGSSGKSTLHIKMLTGMMHSEYFHIQTAVSTEIQHSQNMWVPCTRENQHTIIQPEQPHQQQHVQVSSHQ
jgi:hypothetical protein